MNHWSGQRTDLKASLEHLKEYLGDYLRTRGPIDQPEPLWAAWVDWHLPELHHAIDHIITDHCPDEHELSEEKK